MTTTPGVVLVHGLWHGAWGWDAVRALLDEAGVHSVAVDLSLRTLEQDTAAVRSALDAFGRPAVLVGHSYGGAVITGAGTHPAVRRLVYLAAFQLGEGESVSRVLPDRAIAPTRLTEALRPSADGGEIDLDRDLALDLLYNGVPVDEARAALTRTRPVSRALFRGVPEEFAWHDVPSTYVVCSEDLAVAPELERAMAERATRVLEWPCGHIPMAAMPEAVAALLIEEATAAG